ncbi:MAG: hypothetical protein AAF125_00560 [Chloroflexota bacterium]
MQISQSQIRAIAQKHRLSDNAVVVLAKALRRGHGRMARFNHRELGGIGMWGRGEVIIGDMRNESLRMQIWGAMNDLLPIITSHPPRKPEPEKDSTLVMPWWGDITLGPPTVHGAFENMTFGYFLEPHRVILRNDGVITHYDARHLGVLDLAVTHDQRGAPVITLVTLDGPLDVMMLDEIPIN